MLLPVHFLVAEGAAGDNANFDNAGGLAVRLGVAARAAVSCYL